MNDGVRPGASRGWRIAVVTQGYQSAGGVQTVARWLVDGIRAAGHDVSVFNLATARNDCRSRRLLRPRSWGLAALVQQDINEAYVYQVGANAVEFEICRYWPRRELTRLLRSHDMVQVIAGAPSLALAARRADRPLALQVATTVTWERKTMLAQSSGPRRWARALMTRAVSRCERAALAATDAVLVENVQMQDYVRALTAGQVVLAPPGVDTLRFTPHARGWQAGGHILSVARFGDPRKGLDRLLRSYALMVSRCPDVPDLVLAGRGAPSDTLRSLVTDLGLERRVTLRSDILLDDLVGLYKGASVYLQTSYEEGLGISVLEAMSSGVPVVATETAGTLETVAQGETGWLVPQGPQVEKSVAERSLTVLHGGVGAAMAAAARKRAVELFSSEATLDRFLQTYDTIMLRKQS